MDATLLKIKTKSRSTVLSLMRKISLSIKTESPPIKIETSLLGPWTSNSSELPDLKLPISYCKGKYILLISDNMLRHIFYKSFEKQINISILTHYSSAKKEESNKRRE